MGTIHYDDAWPWADPGEWYCYGPGCGGQLAITRVIQIGDDPSYYCESCLMTSVIMGELTIEAPACSECGDQDSSVCRSCYQQNYDDGLQEGANNNSTECEGWGCSSQAQYCEDCASSMLDSKCESCGEPGALCYDHAREDWDLYEKGDIPTECEYCDRDAYDMVCRDHWDRIRCPECGTPVSCNEPTCPSLPTKASAAQPVATGTDDGQVVTVDGITIKFNLTED